MTTQNTVQTYLLKFVEMREETLSKYKRPIDEEGCFTEIDDGRPVWKCRDYHEYVYVKDNYLVVSKYYTNCIQANVIYEEENPQLVSCVSSRLEHVYELVPVNIHDLVQKMRRIVENVRICRSVLAGVLLYAVRHNNKLYVLDFSYDPILNCTRAAVKYVVPV